MYSEAMFKFGKDIKLSMSDPQSSPHENVSEHYSIGDLGDRILAALEAAVKELEALTVDDLAPVDAFHIRGRTATEELAQWAEV